MTLQEKNMEKTRKVLRKLGDRFLKSVTEEVNLCVLLCDTNRLERLTSLVDMHLSFEIITTIKEKGFSDELTRLCNKIGNIKIEGK